jgi:hypothetical protein
MYVFGVKRKYQFPQIDKQTATHEFSRPITTGFNLALDHGIHPFSFDIRSLIFGKSERFKFSANILNHTLTKV